MCLAVPAKIISIQDQSAVIEVNGVRRSANVALIQEPKLGDYVIVHAGFAIQKWSEDDVKEYNAIMQEMAGLDQPQESRNQPREG